MQKKRRFSQKSVKKIFLQNPEKSAEFKDNFPKICEFFNFAKFANIEFVKHQLASFVVIVDFENCYKMRIWLQNFVSIELRKE